MADAESCVDVVRKACDGAAVDVSTGAGAWVFRAAVKIIVDSVDVAFDVVSGVTVGLKEMSMRVSVERT